MKQTKRPKKLFYILHDGKMVGKSWAVSPEKARANYWWKVAKCSDKFSPRDYNPEDFDVIEGTR